jgi:transcriptional antiterminator Rof (Rho-off)
MTRDQVEIAINEGIPFVIKMADGEKYEVNDRLQVALGKTQVVVLDKEGLAHVLPLLTMTGISYVKSKR